MLFKKALASLLVVCLFVPAVSVAGASSSSTGSSPLDSSYSFAGQVTRCALDPTGANLLVSGNIGDASNVSKISLYVVKIDETDTALNFAARKPFYTADSGIAKDFSFTVPVRKINDTDTRYGVVFTSKVAVVITKKDGGMQLVDFAKYLSNPGAAAANKEPLPAQKSIKGVGVLIPSDLEQLGVQYTTINVLLWNMLTLTSHGSGSIPYVFEGKTYYFKKDYINNIDNTLLTCYKNHMSVLGILLMNNSENSDTDSPAKYYAHPRARSGSSLVAVNMTDDLGIQYYKAIISFLARRYSRADAQYGQFIGYIVGNEIGTSTVSDCMGNISLNDYVDQYSRWMRLTNSIVKQAWSSARVYASFDHDWTVKDTDTGFVGFANKDLIDGLTRVSRLQGDYDWNVAWHPYPENIYKIDTWNDADATDSFDTQYIDFKNLQVLSRYLGQTSYRCDGARRHVILSEEGFTSGSNSEFNQTLQAAAYAYAYYKCLSVPGIDFFSMNGQVDNSQEMSLNLGLWTYEPGTFNTAYQQKSIYNVFKNIDTVNSLEVTQFALNVIGQSMGKTITDWKQIIPEFNEAAIKAKCSRPAEASAPGGSVKDIAGAATLSAGSTDGWSATDDTASLVLCKDGTSGQSVPAVSVLSNIYSNQPKDYRGLTYMPKRALDLTKTPVVTVDARLAGLGAGKKADFIIRAYSGDRVIESAVYTGNAEQWNTLSADFSGWSGLSSVDRIKVWVRAHDDVALTSGTISVNNLQAAVSATITNVKITTDVGMVNEAGDIVHFTIENDGNRAIRDPVGIQGANGLTTDISSQTVDVEPLSSATFPVTIASYTVPDTAVGKINLTIEGTAYPVSLTIPSSPDYIMDGDKLVLGEFEGGLTDNWVVGKDANILHVVTNSYETHRNPAAASTGQYFLNVQRGPYIATTPAYTTKTFRSPLDLSDYGKLYFDFNGYGGASSSGYVVSVLLTATDGTTKEYDQRFYPPDDGSAWTTLSIDISDFVGRNSLQSVSIGYAGNDAQVYGGNWQGWFSLDNIFAAPLGD